MQIIFSTHLNLNNQYMKKKSETAWIIRGYHDAWLILHVKKVIPDFEGEIPPTPQKKKKNYSEQYVPALQA